MSKLASLIKMVGRNPESKAAAIATAATTGITIAKFLGKRSIYGAIAGVGVSLIAKKLMEKQAHKTTAQDDIIEHAPLQPDPNAPKRGE
ncbi:MAG: hypothetical protein KA221_07825 [Vitreoscilla sp.]|jgi:hypothetical protein|nr:hypothetical protein [Vitreoscilla sp.]MBP9540601.1 hypothetical protein [Vitreoscilla sp.]